MAENDILMQITRAISEADHTCDGDYRKLARAALETIRELDFYDHSAPRYCTGEYSRRNLEAFVDDALSRP